MSELRPTLGAYIQVPFCRTKCTYCNFHTGVFSKTIYTPYVDAVVREIAAHQQLYRGAKLDEHCGGAADERLVDTVYIGGGTPSLLEPSALGRMLDGLRRSFNCAFEEVTLEADPETIMQEKADAWLASGIDRVSLGTQSFVDRELAAAGRLHRRDDIYRCVETLRDARLANFSFDLIAGLPHQTSESWQTSLDEVCRLSPSHVSVYMLEIDEGSRLGRESLAGGARYSVPSLPGDDDTASFYERACEQLAAFGYEHYEISNWALPGKRSAHNLKYWQRAPYLGFGAGAHSFDGLQRWANVHDPSAYVAAITAGRLPIEQREPVSSQSALDEELFLGLRLVDGIDVPAIEKRYNIELRDRVAGLVEQGLVEWQGSRLRLVPGRLTISNEVFVELLS